MSRLSVKVHPVFWWIVIVEKCFQAFEHCEAEWPHQDVEDIQYYDSLVVELCSSLESCFINKGLLDSVGQNLGQWITTEHILWVKVPLNGQWEHFNTTKTHSFKSHRSCLAHILRSSGRYRSLCCHLSIQFDAPTCYDGVTLCTSICRHFVAINSAAKLAGYCVAFLMRISNGKLTASQ